MNDDSQSFAFGRGAVLRGIALLQVALIVVVVVPGVPSLVRLPVAVTYLTIVPGLLLSSLLGINDRVFATKAVYVAGLSFVFVMTLGAGISLFYPLIGIEQPLTPISLLTTIGVAISILAVLIVQSDSPLSLTMSVSSIASPVPLTLLLLPFVSILGTVYYHVIGSNMVLVAMLALIALVPLIMVVVEQVREDTFGWYALATWTISLALVYHGRSLLPPYLGSVKAGSLTMQSGIWMPNAQGLGGVLPNTVLYPIYAILGGVPLSVETAIVNPLFVSILPVVLFELFRRQTSQLYAFLSCCVFMFSFPYYVLYPGAGRVASPVLFLALMGLALSDRSFSPNIRSGIALAFSAGVVVSHYGTAWVGMFALLGAFTFYHTVRMRDKLLDADAPSSIGGFLRSLLILAPSFPSKYLQREDNRYIHDAIPSLSFVSAYSVVAIVWYIYTSKGVKFTQLAIKIVDAIQGVLYTEFTGSAANAANKQYGSQIVATSRMVYILLGVLLAAGIVVAVYQRVIKDDSIVGDGFLALGVGFAAMLVGSMLPSGKGFAIARVMMIVFTFTLPFVLVGVDALVSTVEATIERVGLNPNLNHPIPGAVIAIVLAVFLVLNVGVVPAISQDGFSPSQKLGQERLVNSNDPIERGQVDACTQCNIEAHVWIMQHNASDRTVYADEYVQSQTDFYHSALVPRVPFDPQPRYYQPITTLNGSNLEDSYVVLISRNLDTDGVYTTRYEWVPFGELQSRLSRSNQVYDSGFARIYAGHIYESRNE